ncbi:hypothetical protein C789_3317 [Microcystis aeruginosa FACHB-905 = DIANCHI905]|uniref:Similarity. hypothetical start n=1 Tax=Microcystis aeruginosa (strain PCC 7806) TaxID=267872 RepID=A8YK90_MICA7|nr:hypothetical protein C789_3317 [Microcystis aeruginosa FACHB-905 = DIANCHI905]TRT96993.1 MAG: hypothetical protein EWV61_19650 [Microcystis aeruginosa Ma_AC_P_19900807_S300]CAO87788.1 unnamed protein product [Microcystis aeruginosa PCC 7806]
MGRLLLYAYVKKCNTLLSYVASFNKKFLETQKTSMRWSVNGRVINCQGSAIVLSPLGLSMKFCLFLDKLVRLWYQRGVN